MTDYKKMFQDYESIPWMTFRKRWPEYDNAVPLHATEPQALAWFESKGVKARQSQPETEER